MWCMWKTCFLCFKINYFNYLYFHSMPWLVCWVVSDLLRQEWLKEWKKKHTKMEGKHKTEFLKKLASTRSHGRRGRMPSANQQRRGRMTDATARLKQNTYDAAAWLTRPRDKKSSEWRDRVIHADAWQRPRTRNCRKRSQRFLKPFLAQIQVQKA